MRLRNSLSPSELRSGSDPDSPQIARRTEVATEDEIVAQLRVQLHRVQGLAASELQAQRSSLDQVARQCESEAGEVSRIELARPY